MVVILALSSGSGRAVKLDLDLEAKGLIPPEDLMGEWLAIIEHKGYPQPVTLRIQHVEPGETAGKMTYASPRRCFLDLEYGGPHEGRHIFYIIRFSNCFEYRSTDFVAIAKAPEAERPGRPEESAAKAAPRPAEAAETAALNGFKTLGPGPQPDTAQEGEAKPPQAPEEEPDEAGARQARQKTERVVFSVNLGGEERESGILVRQ